MNTMDTTTTSSQATYQTALRTAVMTGVFSAMVCALLVVNSYRSLAYDPLASRELKKLKATLVRQPEEEALKNRIRKLDLDLRQKYFRQRELSSRGTDLFLLGTILFVLSSQYAAVLRKRLPLPKPGRTSNPWDARTAWITRWWVSGLGVAFAALLLSYALKPQRALTHESLRAATADGTGGSGKAGGVPTPEEWKKNWPSFRGPEGLGVSAFTDVPTSWDGATGKGVLWKAPVPLPGMNSPIVWNDRVFLSGANETQHEVYCYEAKTGRVLWRASAEDRGASQPPSFDISPETSYAAPTMATDGQRVFALFATGALAAFDFEGKKAWSQNLGLPKNSYGHSSSLAVSRNLLFVLFDQGSVEDKKSKLLALDTETGKTVWEQKRPVGSNWTSPIVVETEKGQQVITVANPWAIAYDPAKGEELWRAGEIGGETAPSPTFAKGVAFAIAPGEKLVAIRTDGRGDVSKTKTVWTADQNIPDICSPVSNGDLVFLLTSSGAVTCYDGKEGKKLWEQYLDVSFRSSPSLVGDKLYLLSQEGVMFIVAAAKQYKLLGKAELGEECYACPAFAEGRIYLRGKQNLYCLGK